MYTFSFIVGNIIPKSVKCIHSATKLKKRIPEPGIPGPGSVEERGEWTGESRLSAESSFKDASWWFFRVRG